MSNITPSYPQSIKVFVPVVDGTSTIMAEDVNSLQAEVNSIEATLGINPFVGLPYNNLGQTLADLYASKASSTHVHSHGSLTDLNVTDDHPAYVRVDGTRGFSAPVVAPAATTSSELAILGQLSGLGFATPSQVTSTVSAAVANLVKTLSPAVTPLAGVIPSNPSWVLQGGMAQGNLDGNGQLHVVFSTPFENALVTFIPTKLVPSGGWFAPYDFQNSDCAAITYGVSTVGVQFFQGDTVYAGNPGVGLTYIALGC